MSTPPTNPTEASRVSATRQWQSYEQLAQTPEFQALASKEFPGYANVFESTGEAEGEGFDRRRFMQLMAASVALATGAVGCTRNGEQLILVRRPEIEILPYTKKPEDVTPGLPSYYATTLPRAGGGFPIIAESNEGRPTKLEGNPQHPASLGASDSQTQASVLDLYHPDRSRFVRVAPIAGATQQDSTWAKFDEFAAEKFAEIAKDQGDGFAILAEDLPAPTLRLVRKHLAKVAPKASYYTYEAIHADTTKEATTQAFGAPHSIHLKLDKADVVLALDADPLGADVDHVVNARGFRAKRHVGSHVDEKHPAKMNRLYVAESAYSVTGANADHRLRLPASHILDFTVALAKVLVKSATVKAALDKFEVRVPADEKAAKRFNKWVEEVAKDLEAAKGKSVVTAGPRQPAVVQALVAQINETLGNNHVTVEYRKLPDEGTKPFAELAKELTAGKVKTLLILGGNPAFTAPADVPLADLIKKVPTSIRLGLHEDETSALCTWHLPQAHFLESWGDAETSDGTYSSIQPLIAPLHGGRSALEVLAKFTKFEKTEPFDILKLAFAERTGLKDDTKAFRKFIHLGFHKDSATPVVKPTPSADNLAKALGGYQLGDAVSDTKLEVTFHADYRLHDGRYAGNGWLQELPDPITKLVWDNAALISATTAKRLGLKSNDLVQITVGGKTLETVAVFVTPGQTDNSIALQLGHGRLPLASAMTSGTGEVGGGGFNIYPLRTSANPWTVVGAEIKPLGRRYRLVSAQSYFEVTTKEVVEIETLTKFNQGQHEHHAHNKPKPGVDYKGHQGKALEHHGHHDERKTPGLVPLHIMGDLSNTPAYEARHQWGMVIDLNTCTGCSACMVACQAENNVPVVGKDEVARNRVMHWIRVDRYFVSPNYTEQKSHNADQYGNEPQLAFQPLACVHCEKAPCETVCPVNAAVHSPEGLNLQVYNRCIGTRYCSNNCPYKVRRFNWFDYNQRPLDQLRLGPITERGTPETLKMVKNPDVSIRMRGIMEKCTYCVQRIERGKIGHKLAVSRKLQKNEDVKRMPDGAPDYMVPDGSITPACAQACPSQAIVFGNLTDANAKVTKIKQDDPRNYRLLDGELTTRPRTSYLAKLRNPNETLAEFETKLEKEAIA